MCVYYIYILIYIYNLYMCLFIYYIYISTSFNPSQ